LPKLNQVIAVEKGLKNRVIADLDQIDKAFQKPNLFDGQVKTYKKNNESEEDVPTVKQNVQVKAREALMMVHNRLSILLDASAAKDIANLSATADVEVDGEKLAEQVPATYLLFLEKQLTDLHTLVGRIPILDPAEVWKWDEAQGLFRAEATLTSRTKKVQKPIVLYPHSEKHPAQTQLVTEDVVVGTYELVKLSGAVPVGDKRGLLARIEKLQHAVKVAREQANTVEAPPQSVGTKITAWLFRA
jgi:hypothetical protein